jgi:CHAT domain-containing protein/Tfp pilus assembly protein PilF
MPVRWLAVSLAAAVMTSAGPAAVPHVPAPHSPSQQTAQETPQRPDDLLARAKQTYDEVGPRAALPLFERVLARYREARDRRGEAIALGLIGNCYKKFGDHRKALDYLDRALAMKRELGDRLEEGKTLSHLGLVYWEMAAYPAAIDHLTRSIAIGRELGDRQLEGSALNNLSLVYDEMGDYRRSLEQYQRVLEIYRGTSFARGEGDTLGNIGGVYLLLGRYGEALRYYQQALAISERLQLNASVSQDLGNLALCYLGLGQVPQAVEHFDRALRLAREAGLKKEEADWLKGKAGVFVHTGDYPAAIEAYRQALAVYEQARLQRELVEALNDQGILYQRLGDGASAERCFRRAIDVSRAIGHARGVTVNLAALGDLEWRRGRLEHAEALYRDALARATTAEDRATSAAIRVALSFVARDQGRLEAASGNAEQAIKDAQACGARPLEGEALFARGEVARARREFGEALRDDAGAGEIARSVGDPELGWRAEYGRAQALEGLDRNDEAVASYQQAVRVIESVRDRLREERYRSSYLEDKYRVYVSLVRLLLKLGRTEEAFAYAEKLRSRHYLDWIDHGVPPVRDEARRQTEVALRERVRQLERAIEQERERPIGEQAERRQAGEIFNSELVEAERAYEDYVGTLSVSEPAYAAARSLAAVSSSDVQRCLADEDALVEYLVGDDAVSIFLVRPGGIQATTSPIRAVDLDAKVELLRDLIVREPGNSWRAPAHSLYESLVAPLDQAGWLAGVRRLFVVPHGILHYVPFAALPRERGDRARLLAQDYVVAYLPSAATLTGEEARHRHVAESVMAMAPARARLPYSRQEATAVAGLFPKDRLLLVGNRATESAFKTSAARYDVLHLATHGHFDKFNPLLSGVELEPDRREDGRLEVHEILGLRLNADLVVLSACDTALGSGYFSELPAGDDIVGLTRAFLFAGSPSVIASLWAVNDQSTARLMAAFYRRLSAAGKAEALAEAQRELIAGGGRYAHPYFWAPFVLVGQMK